MDFWHGQPEGVLQGDWHQYMAPDQTFKAGRAGKQPIRLQIPAGAKDRVIDQTPQ
jgi:hypothetical protein